MLKHCETSEVNTWHRSVTEPSVLDHDGDDGPGRFYGCSSPFIHAVALLPHPRWVSGPAEPSRAEIRPQLGPASTGTDVSQCK